MPSPQNPFGNSSAAGAIGNMGASGAAALQALQDAFGAFKATIAGTLSPMFTLNSAFKSLGTAVSSTSRMAAEGARTIAGAFAEMGRYATQVAGLISAPLLALEAGIAAVNVGVARFVKLASPGVFMRFQLAVDDLYASIGRALIPVLERATLVFRTIGSAIFSLDGTGQKVIQGIIAATIGLTVFGAVTVGLVTILSVGATALMAFATAVEIVKGVLSMGLLPVITAIIGGLGGGALASLIPIFSGIGAAVAGFMAMTGDFKPLLDKLAVAFRDVMNAIGEALSSFSGSDILTPVLSAIVEFVKVFAGLFAAAVKMVMPGIAAMASVLGNLAPVIFKVGAALAALAFGPLLAVLSPIISAVWLTVKAFEVMRPALDTFAKVFTSVFDQVISLFMDLGSLFVDVVSEILGIESGISGLTSMFREFAITVAALVQSMGNLITRMINWIRGFLGLGLPGSDNNQKRLMDSTGAAARSTSTGSVEDVLRRARESAFSLGTGAISADDKTANNTDQINKAIQAQMEKIDAFVSNLPGVLKEFAVELVEKMADKFPGLRKVGEAASGAAQGARSAADSGALGIGGIIASQIGRLV